jgi:hypothetical protein
MTSTQTAQSLRQQAADHEAEAAASFERCDTDGFASQAAHALSADRLRLAAQLAEQGGKWEFTALFDLDGNLVRAKRTEGQYGTGWMLLDEQGQSAGWFNPSRSLKAETVKAHAERKGYRFGTVRAEAVAVINGGGTGFAGMASCYATVVPRSRDDLAMGVDVEIVDNGLGEA